MSADQSSHSHESLPMSMNTNSFLIKNEQSGERSTKLTLSNNLMPRISTHSFNTMLGIQR